MPAPAETTSTPCIAPSHGSIDKLEMLLRMVKILSEIVVAVIALSVYGIINLNRWLTKQLRRHVQIHLIRAYFAPASLPNQSPLLLTYCASFYSSRCQARRCQVYQRNQLLVSHLQLHRNPLTQRRHSRGLPLGRRAAVSEPLIFA